MDNSEVRRQRIIKSVEAESERERCREAIDKER